MLRYLHYPKRYELSPNHSRIVSRSVNAFFYVALLLAFVALGWVEHVAAEDKTVLAKGARIAVFPLDLQWEAMHHTGVIHGAIRQVLEATEPTQLDFFFDRGAIPQRGQTFSKHPLSYITEPGWTIERVFKQVRIAVVNETRGKQVPWESSSLLGDFYFVRE